MKPACEACGAPDIAVREAMLRAGQRELTIPPGFRPTILCDGCRPIEIAFIQTLLQDQAERAIATERTAAGLAPLEPEDLAAQARRRWHHAEPASPVIVPPAARMN